MEEKEQEELEEGEKEEDMSPLQVVSPSIEIDYDALSVGGKDEKSAEAESRIANMFDVVSNPLFFLLCSTSVQCTCITHNISGRLVGRVRFPTSSQARQG